MRRSTYFTLFMKDNKMMALNNEFSLLSIFHTFYGTHLYIYVVKY